MHELDLKQLVSAVEELPFLSSSSQVEQTSQLLPMPAS
ncbi:hypothetical protein HaLaN_21161 [Haematococcus lacustris]|uniref:Uncharacterized protein n=1 Tax=Haematococcus lacustris TaxID=44745 RepID=A0A699ZL79_HAELA|nr:hypothetical protein HaLaN_21161 [Haematococcus lacustris]